MRAVFFRYSMRVFAFVAASSLVAQSAIAVPRREREARHAKRSAPARPDARPNDARAISAEAQVALAEKAIAALEYDDAILFARDALKRTDIEAPLRQRALFLLGSALAIIGDPTDADEPFRELLRADPGYDIASTTEPKVAAAFRRVQVDEATHASRARAAERAQRIAGMRIDGAEPTSAHGGLPLAWELRVQDPSGSVRGMRVFYRRNLDDPYAMLPLQIGDDNAWRGAIPGDFTASPFAYRLAWYVETIDDDGEALVMLGAPSEPKTTAMEAGEVKRARPVYKTWWFWGITALGVAAAGTTAVVIYNQSKSLPRSDLGNIPVN